MSGAEDPYLIRHPNYFDELVQITGLNVTARAERNVSSPVAKPRCGHLDIIGRSQGRCGGRRYLLAWRRRLRSPVATTLAAIHAAA